MEGAVTGTRRRSNSVHSSRFESRLVCSILVHVAIRWQHAHSAPTSPDRQPGDGGGLVDTPGSRHRHFHDTPSFARFLLLHWRRLKAVVCRATWGLLELQEVAVASSGVSSLKLTPIASLREMTGVWDTEQQLATESRPSVLAVQMARWAMMPTSRPAKTRALSKPTSQKGLSGTGPVWTSATLPSRTWTAARWRQPHGRQHRP